MEANMPSEDGNDNAPAMLSRNSKSVFIDADHLQRLLNTGKEAKSWDKCSIYKVPSYFIPGKQKFDKPQFVSVGPYHHGATHLNAMEEHKYRALSQFLKRSKKSIYDFKVSMRGCVHQLMGTYEKLDKYWMDEDRFLELMILDGCFVLEILRVCRFGGKKIDYSPSDPIFSNRGLSTVVNILVQDILMLENQLPFLVLEKLLAVEDEKRTDSDKYLNRLLSFVGADICTKDHPAVSKLHIVDFLRSKVIGINKNLQKFVGSELETTSLSTRKRAGIVFEKSKRNFLSDIKLEKNVLHLPVFELDGFSEVIWLNLLAFECLHAGLTQDIANYIIFMAGLLDKEDVGMLHSAQLLIIRAVGDYQEIKELFGSLWNAIDFSSNSDLAYVMKELQVYCIKSSKKWKRRMREWRLNLKSTYCSTPWKVLSLIAATLIIALTIVQTVYTILSYYHSSK